MNCFIFTLNLVLLFEINITFLMNILFGQSKIVHFIGIGGCGMSGLAELLLKKSFKVQGSDSEQNIST